MRRFPLGLLLRSKWFVFLVIAMLVLVWVGARELLGIGPGTYSARAALVWLFLVGLVGSLIHHHLTNFHPIANVMGEEAIDQADYAERALRAQEKREGRNPDQNNDRWM